MIEKNGIIVYFISCVYTDDQPPTDYLLLAIYICFIFYKIIYKLHILF